MEKISTAEFEIMRVIWANQPVYTKDIIDILKKNQDWSDSTIKTLLSRLVKKNFVEIDQSSTKFKYTATLDKNEYVEQEMRSLLEKVCDTTKMKLLMDMISEIEITNEDYTNLINLLNSKPKKEKLDCHCPKGLCDYEKV